MTVAELEKKVKQVVSKKFSSLFAAFTRNDPEKTGDIPAESFREALAQQNFVMDDETFELFCSMWMDKSSLTKLNVTGNINYEAFKRKYGSLVLSLIHI